MNKENKLTNSKLFLMCTVCHEPMPIEKNVENGLLHFDTIICERCKQTNYITEKLRDYVRQTK